MWGPGSEDSISTDVKWRYGVEEETLEERRRFQFFKVKKVNYRPVDLNPSFS